MSWLPRKSPTLELAAEIAEMRRQGKTVHSLSTPTFPRRELAAAPGLRHQTGLTASRGMAELRDAARSRLFGKWQSASHDCVMTAGAKAAIFSVLRGCVPTGGPVLVVSPHWPSYDDIAMLARFDVAHLQTKFDEGFRIEEAVLRKKLAETGAAAVICSNPGNPTGRVLSGEEVDALCAATRDAGSVLLLDESFAEIVFDAARWQASAARLDGHIFVVGSFSKAYSLQGLRLGACLVPQQESDAMTAVHQALVSAAPTPSQTLALQILNSPNPVPEDYSRQRQLILGHAKRAGWELVPPDGGFHMFPRLADADAFRRVHRSYGVLSLPGEAFGAPYGNHVRACFGKPFDEMADLVRVLDMQKEQQGRTAP